MDALLKTSASFVLAEFFAERLREAEHQFVNCNKDTFETQKGRVIELTELLKISERKGV